jgi:uncharacterized protein
METIGTVETICRYPVKSMAGEEVAQAFVGFAGLMGDRAFAFVRTSGPKDFPWHTGREQEDLVLFRPHFREGGATTLPPDIEEAFKMAPGVNPIFPAEDAFEIDTPDGRTLPLRSPELKAMIEQRAGYAVTLRFSERSLYDCRPVSLFGNASAKGLGDELAMPIDRRRFRANFYADWTEDRPYRENDLVGRSLQIGERLHLAVLERDQTKPRVLRHVKKAHDGMAGVYAAVLVEGVVRHGDPIHLI